MRGCLRVDIQDQLHRFPGRREEGVLERGWAAGWEWPSVLAKGFIQQGWPCENCQGEKWCDHSPSVGQQSSQGWLLVLCEVLDWTLLNRWHVTVWSAKIAVLCSSMLYILAFCLWFWKSLCLNSWDFLAFRGPQKFCWYPVTIFNILV